MPSSSSSYKGQDQSGNNALRMYRRGGRSGQGRSAQNSSGGEFGRGRQGRRSSGARTAVNEAGGSLYPQGARIRKTQEDVRERRQEKKAQQTQTRAQKLRANIRGKNQVNNIPLEEKKMTGPVFYFTLALAILKDIIGVIALILNFVIPFSGILFGFLTALISVLIWILLIVMGVRGFVKTTVTPGIAFILELIPFVKAFFWETCLVIGARIAVNHGIKKRNAQKTGKKKKWFRFAGKARARSQKK